MLILSSTPLLRGQVVLTVDDLTVNNNRDFSIVGFNMAKLFDDSYFASACTTPSRLLEIGNYLQSYTSPTQSIVLRFPGGGNSSHFMHLDHTQPGYNFDFPDVALYDPVDYFDDIGGVNTNWQDRIDIQNGATCSFLELFVDLVDFIGFDRVEVVWTANITTGNPCELEAQLDYLLSNGVNVYGVELGNEIYALKLQGEYDNSTGTTQLVAIPDYERVFEDPFATGSVSDVGKASLNYLKAHVSTALFPGCSEHFLDVIEQATAPFPGGVKVGVPIAPVEAGNAHLTEYPPICDCDPGSGVCLQAGLGTAYDRYEEARNFGALGWNQELSSQKNDGWYDAIIPHLYHWGAGWYTKMGYDPLVPTNWDDDILATLEDPADMAFPGAVAPFGTAFGTIKDAMISTFRSAPASSPLGSTYTACDGTVLDISNLLEAQFNEMESMFRPDMIPLNKKEVWVTEWNWSNSNPNFSIPAVGNTFWDAAFTFTWLNEAFWEDTKYLTDEYGITIGSRQLFLGKQSNFQSLLARPKGALAAYDQNSTLLATQDVIPRVGHLPYFFSSEVFGRTAAAMTFTTTGGSDDLFFWGYAFPSACRLVVHYVNYGNLTYDLDDNIISGLYTVVGAVGHNYMACSDVSQPDDAIPDPYDGNGSTIFYREDADYPTTFVPPYSFEFATTSSTSPGSLVPILPYSLGQIEFELTSCRTAKEGEVDIKCPELLPTVVDGLVQAPSIPYSVDALNEVQIRVLSIDGRVLRDWAAFTEAIDLNTVTGGGKMAIIQLEYDGCTATAKAWVP